MTVDQEHLTFSAVAAVVFPRLFVFDLFPAHKGENRKSTVQQQVKLSHLYWARAKRNSLSDPSRFRSCAPGSSSLEANLERIPLSSLTAENKGFS